MKNFLEALGTDPKLKVEISIRAIIDNGYPDFNLFFNEKLIAHHNQTQIHLIEYIRYDEKLSIKIKMFGKKYSALKESAIIVENISIDDINIIPTFSHYTVYNNDHNKPITTNYLGYNGDWSININEPFYHWYHSVTAQGILIKS
jgi:hypothetical protein